MLLILLAVATIVASTTETEVGDRKLTGECRKGGNKIKGACDTRPGYTPHCSTCTYGWTPKIWGNNWCCTDTESINPKGPGCTCPSSATETEVGADDCGCMKGYCTTQVLDADQCCEYYRENSACPGATKSKSCAATCAGQTFTGGSRMGQDVCSNTICQAPLTWVNLKTGGCIRTPWNNGACCDQTTCTFQAAESAVGGTKAGACTAEDIVAGCTTFQTTSAFCYCRVPGISGKGALAEEVAVSDSQRMFVDDRLFSSTLATVHTTTGPNLFVYGFAAVGFGFLAFGAMKHFTRKTEEEYATVV